jgi:dUTP pyrophosphatase
MEKTAHKQCQSIYSSYHKQVVLYDARLDINTVYFYDTRMAQNTDEIKCSVASGAKLPEYQTAGAAGADICAYIDEPVVIPSGSWALIPTGLCFEIPHGFEIQMRPRSGLAAKYGITLLNSPGTIDSDYRGEIKIMLINHGKDAYTVNDGDRIAQAVTAEVTQMRFTATETLSDTQRGTGGFGSTGK